MGWVGPILSANRLIRLVSNTMAGQVVVRFGRRIPFIAATAMATIICASYGIMSGALLFVIARVIWGICWSFLRMEGLQTVLDVASTTTKGKIFARMYAHVARMFANVA